MVKRIIFYIDGALIIGVSFGPFIKNSFVKIGVRPKVEEFESSCNLY